MLGFNETHHMVNVVRDFSGHEVREWTRAMRAKYRGEGTFDKEDWDRLLGGYQGCIDYPSALFATDLAKLYPDAKVVMLNREPEKWYESMRETVEAFRHPGLLERLRRFYCGFLNPRVREWEAFWTEVTYAEGGHDHSKDKARAIAFMQENYDECRREVDASRRIEWKVQDGWEPLCEHLGVPVPKVEDPKTGKMMTAPFPRVNDRETFKKNASRGSSSRVEQANDVLFGLIGRGVTAGAFGYGAYIVWKMYKK